MAFGFPSKKGVKTGMRQNNGAKRNTVKLRPPPAKAPTASSSRPPDDSDNRTPYYQRDSTHQQQDQGDDQDEEGFTYQDQLRGESRPLEGANITVSGCGADKRMLMTLAAELGAKDCTSLTIQTTHLIADAFGSAKCDMALKCNMKIMDPKWLLAVRDAWRDAENVDFAEVGLAHDLLGFQGTRTDRNIFLQLEENHRLPALKGTVVTLTQFPPGSREGELMMVLQAAGAEITKRLTKRTTHLIVSSTTSGHLPHTSKLEYAISARGRSELPKMVIVWEGWLEDAIRRGGRTEARDAKWKYEPGGEAPDMLEDDDINPIASTSNGKTRKGSTIPPTSQFRASKSHWGPSATAGEDGRGTKSKANGEEADELDDNTVVVRKKRARIDNDPLLGPMAIKLRAHGSLSLVGSAAMGREDEADGELAAPNEMARRPLGEANTDNGDNRPSDQGKSATNDEDPFALGQDRGGSIIKALSSTRSRRFDEAETSRPRMALISKRSLEGHAPNPLAADDSAFFEGNDDAQMGTESKQEESSDPPIFEGLKFSLMGMQGKNRDIIKRAVEERRGQVLIDRLEPTTDHIVVDFFGAPREYLGPDADPRVITGCWIESCIHEDRLVPFDDRLLERPLPYEIPIKGADKLKVHLSGFSDIGKIHTRRFLKEIGAGTSKVFNRSCTHLIHVDAGKEVEGGKGPAGLKVDKAREWGTPIEGPDWLRNWAAQRGVIPSTSSAESATSGTTQDKKGKGKATEAPRDITNESHTRRSRARTTPPMDVIADENQPIENQPFTSGALTGCVIFVSNKLASGEKKKVIGIVTKLGAAVPTSFDPFTATHLVYASNRPNDQSTEYKKAKLVQTCIVHPQWAVECELLDERVNEHEFPHTFDPKKGGQLAIVAVTSPAKSQARANLVFSAGERRPSQPPTSQPLRMERCDSSPSKPATLKRNDEGMDDSFGPLAAAQPMRSDRVNEPSSPRLSQAAEETDAGVGHESGSSSDPAPVAGEDDSLQEAGPKKSGSTQHFDELTRTTTELLAHFADLGGELANPAKALSRKRVRYRTLALVLSWDALSDCGVFSLSLQSHVSNASSKSSMSMSRDGSKTSELLRKVPGQALFEPSQFTQAGEDTYAVEYDDPAEVAARAALAFALGGGGNPAPTTESAEAAAVDHGSEDKETYTRASTRSSARKRKIDTDLAEEDSFDFGRVGNGKRTRGGR